MGGPSSSSSSCCSARAAALYSIVCGFAFFLVSIVVAPSPLFKVQQKDCLVPDTRYNFYLQHVCSGGSCDGYGDAFGDDNTQDLEATQDYMRGARVLTAGAIMFFCIGFVLALITLTVPHKVRQYGVWSNALFVLGGVFAIAAYFLVVSAPAYDPDDWQTSSDLIACDLTKVTNLPANNALLSTGGVALALGIIGLPINALAKSQ